MSPAFVIPKGTIHNQLTVRQQKGSEIVVRNQEDVVVAVYDNMTDFMAAGYEPFLDPGHPVHPMSSVDVEVCLLDEEMNAAELAEFGVGRIPLTNAYVVMGYPGLFVDGNVVVKRENAATIIAEDLDFLIQAGLVPFDPYSEEVIDVD